MNLDIEWIECHELPQAARTILTDSQLQLWVELSCQMQGVTIASLQDNCESLHTRLAKHAETEHNSPLAALFPLWLAEDLNRNSKFAEAIQWYEMARNRADESPLFGAADIRATALHHGAAARAATQDLPGAVDWSRQLWAARQAPDALLDAGQMAETAGDDALATRLYAEIAAAANDRDAESPEQHARRRAQRIADKTSPSFDTVEKLADAVFKALRGRKPKALAKFASHTHFLVGPLGGHLEFDDGELLDLLLNELRGARIEPADPFITGSGDRFHIHTLGWNGPSILGEVSFIFSRWSKGWQWTGITVMPLTDPLKKRWTPEVEQTNQPLSIELEAPWLGGLSCMAGGLPGYIAEVGAIFGFGIFAPLVALAISEIRDCGFGPRGLYYNMLPTHTDEDAFAIDFTHSEQGHPFDNASNRLIAAVPEIGIVASSCGIHPTGADTPNFVEILHDDFPSSRGTNRFLSRYLHMAGHRPGRPGSRGRPGMPARPGVVAVAGALVVEGSTIGPVDSTGNSAIDHLHFSIHDQTRPFTGTPGVPTPTGACSRLTRGSSVRPSPMNGQHLAPDGTEGGCIVSRTTPGMVLYQGGPRATPSMVVVHPR